MRVSASIACDNNQERSSPACHYCHQAALQESTLLHSQAARGSQWVSLFLRQPGLTFTEVLVSLFGCRTLDSN